MRKSSVAVRLTLMGSALALAGCGGNDTQAQRCVGPDGKPNPNGCTTSRGAHGLVALPGGRGGISSGVSAGGFGATAGAGSAAGGHPAAS